VRNAIAAAARRRKPVSIGGEAAADSRAVPLFVGMGVTELGVVPSAVVRVKAQVRRIAAAAVSAFALWSLRSQPSVDATTDSGTFEPASDECRAVTWTVT